MEFYKRGRSLEVRGWQTRPFEVLIITGYVELGEFIYSLMKGNVPSGNSITSPSYDCNRRFLWPRHPFFIPLSQMNQATICRCS
jgi:hypothetical protein